MKRLLPTIGSLVVLVLMSGCFGSTTNPATITVASTGNTPAAAKKSFAQAFDAWFNSQANQSFLAAEGPIVAQGLTTYLAQGGRLSNAQGSALGVQAATAAVPSITTNAQLQDVITQAVVVYSGDPKLKTVGLDVAKIVTNGLPDKPTAAQSTQAIVNAGTLLSNASNQ